MAVMAALWISASQTELHSLPRQTLEMWEEEAWLAGSMVVMVQGSTVNQAVGFRLESINSDQVFWATVNPRTTPIHNTIDSLMNFTSLPLIGDYEEKIPTNLITAAKENASVLEVFLRSYW